MPAKKQAIQITDRDTIWAALDEAVSAIAPAIAPTDFTRAQFVERYAGRMSPAQADTAWHKLVSNGDIVTVARVGRQIYYRLSKRV